MIWQYSNYQTSGREVVRQLQSSLGLHQNDQVSANTGAYFRARIRFDFRILESALTLSARAADNLTQSLNILQQRRFFAIDGSTLTLADSPENRASFPPIQTVDATGFPMMRIGLLSSLSSGAVIGCSHGSLEISELALLKQLTPEFRKGDVLVGDKAYGCYPAITWLQQLGVDFIGRTTRKVKPSEATEKFSQDDWLTPWKRGAKPSPWMSAEEWNALPETFTVRVIQSSIQLKGFRTQSITIVTTLLDPIAYPSKEILEAFHRRWRIEMTIDDLKTTLKMETLQGKSPNVVVKELLIGLIVHNFIRCTMAQAARKHHVPLDRISFKGCVDTHDSSPM
jgi:hypothetical protein